MPKVKVPRKSTAIDMTAMCDVAFLLLSFFILATKFKPPEALTVQMPNSVSSKKVSDTDAVTIIIDKDGKVYLSVADKNASEKKAIVEAISTSRGLNLSAQQINAFARAGSYVGVPFSKLPAFLSTPADAIKNMKLDGIPVLDSTNNELIEWMRASASAFGGRKMEIFVKGDNSSKYPSFKGVIDALKKNDLMKFKMVTNPEGVPTDSEMYKEQERVKAAKK
jgi:biopolymer transport protein ExbD